MLTTDSAVALVTAVCEAVILICNSDG